MKKFMLMMAVALVACAMSSCSNDESYSDRLNTERNATNAFLRNFRVVNEIPADTVFETGENAPYYRLDEDGNVYMQVLRAGDRKTDKARNSESIYFRFMRYSIEEWYSTGVMTANAGNAEDLSQPSYYFNYNDFTLEISSRWGYGLQMPLHYLGVESEVNLVIKSQYGRTDEISYVLPFLYHVRYFHSMI